MPIRNRDQLRGLPLTHVEIETLVLHAAGLSTEEIAQRLNVAPDTVKSRNRQIFGKLDVRNRAHAVAVGFARGILVIGPAHEARAFREAERSEVRDVRRDYL